MENLYLYCTHIGIIHRAGARCRRVLGRIWIKKPHLFSDSLGHSLSLSLSSLPPCTTPLPHPTDWHSLLPLPVGTLAKLLSSHVRALASCRHWPISSLFQYKIPGKEKLTGVAWVQLAMGSTSKLAGVHPEDGGSSQISCSLRSDPLKQTLNQGFEY